MLTLLSNVIKALKTPGKLKGRTPATIRQPLSTRFAAKILSHIASPTKLAASPKKKILEHARTDFEPDAAPLTHLPGPENVEPKPQETADVDSAISDTESSPEVPNIVRKSSMTFASLPPREPLNTRIADEEDEEEWISGATVSSPIVQILGNSSPARGAEEEPNAAMEASSDDSSDEFDVDLRAPELIAHEQRMQEYASPEFAHPKAASTITLASPAKMAMERPASPTKSISVSIPADTTTPQASPRRFMDAAKNKVHSALSSAKRLMAKSAGVSAAAKMEAKSDYVGSPTPRPPKISNDMPGMYPSLDKLEDKPLPATPIPEPRRTRSSTHREEQEKKGKEKEAIIPQATHEVLEKTSTKGIEKAEEPRIAHEKPQPITKPVIGQEPTGKARTRTTQKPLGRPVRPTTAVVKPKPPPVNIKINAMSQRMPVNTAPVAAHNQETVRPEIQRPELKRKASAQSLASTSTSTLRSATSQAAARVLEKAAKKKQQDEEKAQKDAERRKLMREQRDGTREKIVRNESDEDLRKDREARQNSAEKAKKHLVDIDDRDIKRQKSEERQEREEAAAAAKKAAFRAKQQARGPKPPQPPPRQPERPPARTGFHANSDDDDEEMTPTNTPKNKQRPIETRESTQSQLPRLGAGMYNSTLDRQKEPQEPELPPTYPQRPLFGAAPVRPSTLGKKTSIFQSIAEAGTSNVPRFPQPPRNPPQMSQYANGRIPFATQLPTAGQSNAGPGTRPPIQQIQQTIQTVQTVHTSPATEITLPEIHTDSSSDGETSFRVPSWATPGHLLDSLTQQDAAVDPDTLFPAIAPIDMDVVFPNNRSRAHKMHVRTSSANWVRNGDGLTQQEIHEDRLARQTIRNQRGWAYGN